MPPPAAYMGPLPLPSAARYLTREERDLIFNRTGVSVSVRQRAQWQQAMMSLSGPAQELEAALRMAREILNLDSLETTTSKAASKAVPGKGSEKGKGKKGKGKEKSTKGPGQAPAQGSAPATGQAVDPHGYTAPPVPSTWQYGMAYPHAYATAPAMMAVPVPVMVPASGSYWRPKSPSSSSPTPSPLAFGPREPPQTSDEEPQPKKKMKEEPSSEDYTEETEEGEKHTPTEVCDPEEEQVKPLEEKVKVETKEELSPTSESSCTPLGLATPTPTDKAEACPAEEEAEEETNPLSEEPEPTTPAQGDSQEEDPLLPGPTKPV